MMADGGHFFVSYSRVDAAGFALQLADRLRVEQPAYRLWVDVREVAPGQDWDAQIGEAIQTCRAVLFLLTPDSVRDDSGCKNEWAWALKYKKPVIPVRLHSDAGLPFRLASRQYIDATDGVDAGLARLRLFLVESQGPDGVLRELRYRLADAERDLPRARDEQQRLRVERDVQELREQVAAQQQLLRDPPAAAAATEQRIATNMQAERQPEPPQPQGVARARFVNPAPLTAPGYFQDRHTETDQIGEFLRTDDQRLITVVGRGGVGKTAMVCRLLGAEAGRLPDDGAELEVDGIVYLAPGGHPVNFPNLVTGLCRLLPAPAADRLLQRYRDPLQTPAAVMLALLQEFPAGRTIVLLDNFEDLVDTATGAFEVTDTALDEGLRALLDAPVHRVKVIITTRVPPRGLLLTRPEVQRRVDLDGGLLSPYAERVLTAWDPDGKLGIRDAPEELLTQAKDRTRGVPRALEALAAILSADRDTTLPELLEQTAALPGNVVEALVGTAFQRLDPLAQQMMQALAVYPVPVPPVAVDYLLQPHRPAIDAAPVLGRLVNMQFARRDAGRYYLHQVDRDYAMSRIPEGGPGDRGADPAPFTRHALWDRAGNYFQQVRTPRQDWKTLDDLAPQLTEFELRYQGQDYDTAARVLLGVGFGYLFRWGHYRLTIDLHHRLQGHLTDPRTDGASKASLGSCHRMIGEIPRAIEWYERALIIAREIGSREGEANQLIGLGNCCADLGQTTRAIELYEQALTIAQEIGYQAGEASCLGNLGNRYADLGQITRAIDLHEQALTIARDVGDRQGEASHLGNLGNCYADLGQTVRAIGSYEQALTVARDIGDRRVEARCLGRLGDGSAATEEWGRAAQYYREAIDVADATGFAQTQSEARLGLATTLLFAGDLPAAQETIDAARDHPYPPTQPGIALVTGIIRLRQHVTTTAQAFRERLTTPTNNFSTPPSPTQLSTPPPSPRPSRRSAPPAPSPPPRESSMGCCVCSTPSPPRTRAASCSPSGPPRPG